MAWSPAAGWCAGARESLLAASAVLLVDGVVLRRLFRHAIVNREVLMADRSRSPADGWLCHLCAIQTLRQGPDYVFATPLCWPPVVRRHSFLMFWFRVGVNVLAFGSSFSVQPLISHQNVHALSNVELQCRSKIKS